MNGRFDSVSARGLEKVRLLPGDVFAFRRSASPERAFGDVYLIGTTAARSYYKIENKAGRACYGIGDARPDQGRHGAYQLGQILCVPDFPSATRPLLDFTVFHGGGAPAQDRVWRSEGIAADGVRSVAFQAADGRTVAKTVVVDNIYHFASPPKEQVASLVAMDANGKTVYWEPTVR